MCRPKGLVGVCDFVFYCKPVPDCNILHEPQKETMENETENNILERSLYCVFNRLSVNCQCAGVIPPDVLFPASTISTDPCISDKKD